MERFGYWLIVIGTVLGALAVTPALTSAQALAPSNCSLMVDRYLQSGWPSGSTVSATLRIQPVGAFSAAESFETSARLALDYPRYPEVAGHLTGTSPDRLGIALGRHGGELALDVTVDGASMLVNMDGCAGERTVYGSTRAAAVSLTLAEMGS